MNIKIDIDCGTDIKEASLQAISYKNALKKLDSTLDIDVYFYFNGRRVNTCVGEADEMVADYDKEVKRHKAMFGNKSWRD